MCPALRSIPTTKKTTVQIRRLYTTGGETLCSLGRRELRVPDEGYLGELTLEV